MTICVVAIQVTPPKPITWPCTRTRTIALELVMFALAFDMANDDAMCAMGNAIAIYG
jgi:hypothetical protein